VIVRGVQRGFSLVSAIFLLVVLAVLGVAMVSFSTMQNQSQALDVMGSRAYQAAQAGIEWAAYTILATSPVVPGGTVIPAGELAGDLSGFSVSVAYAVASAVDTTVYPPDGTTGTVWSYTIQASAVWGAPGTENYVARVIDAKM
jgi:MSHA biogenesis protein MshP